MTGPEEGRERRGLKGLRGSKGLRGLRVLKGVMMSIGYFGSTGAISYAQGLLCLRVLKDLEARRSLKGF